MINTEFDRAWYILVLKKLKQMLVDGSFVSGEVRYVYEWDKNKSTEDNLADITREDMVLLNLLNAKVIIGDHVPNEYKRQQQEAIAEGRSGVWSDWETVDPARRGYYNEVFLHRIDIPKFEKEIEKYGLRDAGMELIEVSDAGEETALSDPVVVMRGGQYLIHDAWRISYNGQEIKMQPQMRKVAALIMENSNNGIVTSIEMITQRMGVYNVPDVISRARAVFKNATNQDKKFFHNERNIGYRFSG